MTPERWKQIEELFQTALDLPVVERRSYIAQTCAGDDTLREQVEALVAQHDEAGDFIENPLFDLAGFQADLDLDATTLPSESYDDPAIGRIVGVYKITEELGRGGMGAVYLAERADSEFRRRVAIKLIKRGMDTDFILRRFRNERQILASLDHPFIARLLDGGTTDDGLPYFVMEYIEGLPIYRFSDERKLTILDRLRLFRQVCDAVQYAHQHRVIHRDIKPSNILVTGAGVPKLLDFGIAKLLNPELADVSLDPTATAMRLMTPEYASPEQVQGQAVTPATDVYSLGVLLYELLTGHRPYRFLSRAPHEIARVICEDKPVHPSIIITRPHDLLPTHTESTEADALEYLYSCRNATVEDLRRELTGDLDNIVMKALRKEPERRYQSVDQFQEDVTRHLEGRPVSAQPFITSESYPAAVTDSDTLVAEKSIAVLPFKILDAPRDGSTGDDYLGIGLADVIITRLSQLRRFTVRPTSSVLRYGGLEDDPVMAGRKLDVGFVLDGRIQRSGENIRVTVQLLDVWSGSAVWAGQFDEKFNDVLSLEDAITSQVAEAIVPHLTGDERRRLAKRSTDNPEAHEAYMRGRYHWYGMSADGFAKAIVCFQRAATLDPSYAAAYAGIAEYHCWLAVYGLLPPSECLAAAREAAHRAIQLDDTLADAHTALGLALLTHESHWNVAETHFRRAIELKPSYSPAHAHYACQLGMEGRFDESVAEARRACDLDPLNPFTSYFLAWCLYQARRYEEAIAQARLVLQTEPRYGSAHFVISWALRRLGRYQEAIAEAKQAIELLGKIPMFSAALGAAYGQAGRTEDARRVLDDLRENAARQYVTPYHRALVHLQLGERERAFDLLEESIADSEPWVVWLGTEPQFDPLRNDSRFDDLLRRTGNPAHKRLGGQARAFAETQNAPMPQIVPSDAAPATPVPETRPTEDEEANKLYKAGRYFATRRTAEGLRQAVERFQHAVERDPSFALAWAEMADCYSLMNWYIEPPPADAWERAKQAALQSVEADETCADSHASLGFVKLHYDRDFVGAESEFRRAIELRPENPVAHRWRAFNLSAMGRHDEAIAEIRRAQELNPRSPVVAAAFANVLFFAQRFEEATAQCQKSLELDPGSLSAQIILRWSYESRGMYDEAFAVYEQERAFAGETPNTRAKQAHVLAACGRASEAREILDDLVAHRDEQWVTAYEIAVIYSYLNEHDEAFNWLAKAEQEHAVGLTYVRVDPRLNKLRDDPRFDELLQRLDVSNDAPQGSAI